MNEILKPCPFCGEQPHYSERQGEALTTHNIVTWKMVFCRNDCAQVNIPDGYEGGTAVERWNRRAPDPAAAKLAEACDVLKMSYGEVTIHAGDATGFSH